MYCKDPSIKECYVGSTTNYQRRKWKHKSDCNNLRSKSYNYKVYKFIRENGGWNNFEFDILEQFECENKKQKLEREQYYVKLHKTTLNEQIPNRKKNEYYQDNKDKLLKQKKQKYKCKCSGQYTHSNKARHMRSLKHQNWYKTTFEYLLNRSIELDRYGDKLDILAKDLNLV